MTLGKSILKPKVKDRSSAPSETTKSSSARLSPVLPSECEEIHFLIDVTQYLISKLDDDSYICISLYDDNWSNICIVLLNDHWLRQILYKLCRDPWFVPQGSWIVATCRTNPSDWNRRFFRFWGLLVWNQLKIMNPTHSLWVPPNDSPQPIDPKFQPPNLSGGWNRTRLLIVTSQLPHRIVDFLVTITNYNIKLPVLRGSWIFPTN